MARLSEEQKQALQEILESGHQLTDINTEETIDKLFEAGFAQADMPLAFETLETMQAEMDVAIQDSLLQVQEANAASAEEQAVTDLEDRVYSERFERSFDEAGFNELKEDALGAHQGAESLDVQAETIEGGMFGDEVTVAQDSYSANIDSGRGGDTIVSEAENNLINAGNGKDSIEVTSDVNFSSTGTHLLDGGAGVDHYTINVEGTERAYFDQTDQQAYLNGTRDLTVIAELEAGETVTLNFGEGAEIPEWMDSAKELLTHANVELVGDFPSGLEVESQALPDGGTSVTISR